MDGEAYEIERKFLIRFPDMELLRSRATGSEIVQTYLLCPEKGCTARVRKRGWPGSYRYTHTVKTRISDLRRLEQEREISEAEYQALLRQADPALRTLYKQRWCLEYRGQLFEIDLFPFWQDRAFMEIELADEGQELFLPPEIQVIREVTGDRRYTNRALAREIPQETI